MTKEQLIILIVVLFIVFAATALIIFIVVRNAKYKKFVLSESGAIKKINEINKQYVFKTFDSPIKFHHLFDKKGHWYKTEPVAYLSREIRNNLEYWFGIRDKIEFNKEKGYQYFKEIKAAFTPIPSEVCISNKKNVKKCHKIEKREFDLLTKKPQTAIEINVVLQYLSPKGRVNVSKEASFDYIALIRILDSVSTKRVDRKTYERLATVERAILSDSMRYDVLKRDGFRCTLCGLSAKDGAILHVDHIVPISKGGKTELSNLRTLCEKCNIGKSNKIE